MVTTYPASIDNTVTLPLVSDSVTQISASSLNVLRGAIVAVESQLGVLPAGIYGTVRARLDAMTQMIENMGGGGGGGSGVTAVTGTPPIASSGGTTPAISIGAATDSLPGSMSAADKTKLDSFVLTSPAQGDILFYNGTDWVILSPGTTGQFLETQGASMNPQWATAGGSSDIGALLSQTRVEQWIASYNGYGSVGSTNAVLSFSNFLSNNSQPSTSTPPSSPLNSTPRAVCLTGSSATYIGGYSASNYTTAWLGNAAGLGGFTLWARFGLEQAPTGGSLTQQYGFVGLLNVKGFSLPDVSDFTVQTSVDCVGIGFSGSYDSSTYTGNFQIISCNASAVTVTDSGVPLVSGDEYELKLVATANASTIAWTIVDITANTTTSGTITLTLPRNTIFLNFQAGEYMPGSTSGDAYFSLVRYTLETGQ